ncbi:magnesium-transporting ATPase (P-type) [Methanococcus voltae PS]|uniref:Magnesium-transporting ATPase (P-type) n=1 Tax=Methanococcus voltae PS TaxID=523842 RepID=A0ABT2EYH4_METVO|nr:magnesium-transporting ATPase (P-type) [Methanococcus voltae PS]
MINFILYILLFFNIILMSYCDLKNNYVYLIQLLINFILSIAISWNSNFIELGLITFLHSLILCFVLSQFMGKGDYFYFISISFIFNPLAFYIILITSLVSTLFVFLIEERKGFPFIPIVCIYTIMLLPVATMF